jgi:hypothetical protein
MMTSKKPAGIAILIGGPKHDASPAADEGDEADTDTAAETRRSAVRDLFAAVKSGDVEAGVKALGAFNACGEYDAGEPDEDDEAGDKPAKGS